MSLRLVAICFLLAQSAQVAAEPISCPPTAVVVGEDDDVREVSEELHLIGISSTRRDGCDAAEARVSREGPRLAVALRDPSGREESRTVSDAQIAATWIDSQLRGDDAAAPLLRPRLAIAPGATPSEPAAPGPVAADAPPAPDVVDGRSRSTLSFGVGVDSGFGNEGSRWRSLWTSLCTPLGPFCAGGLARLGVGDDSFQQQTKHADLMLQIARPVELGKALLSPYAAGGLGAVQVRPGLELAPCAMTGCMRSDLLPTRLTIAGRLEAGAVLTLPIASWLHLDVNGSYGGAFGVGSRVSMPDVVEGGVATPTPCDVEDCPEPMSDPGGDEPVPPPENESYYDGELYPDGPSRMWILGIGLRIGGL